MSLLFTIHILEPPRCSDKVIIDSKHYILPYVVSEAQLIGTGDVESRSRATNLR